MCEYINVNQETEYCEMQFEDDIPFDKEEVEYSEIQFEDDISLEEKTEYYEMQFEDDIPLEEKTEYYEIQFEDDLSLDEIGPKYCEEQKKVEIPFDEEQEELFNKNRGRYQCINKKRERLLKEGKTLKVNLVDLEDILYKHVYIRKIRGRVNYYDGASYRFLSEKVFYALCKKFLPKDILQTICSTRIFKSLYEFILCGFELVDEKYEDSQYIAFLNGIYDLNVRKLYKHDSKYETPYCVQANYKEEDYGLMSNFESLIYQMTGGDEECIELIWETLGYLLLHVTPKRAFFWLGTEPATGKSLIGDFIVRLFGMSNCSQIPANGIGGRFNLAQFVQCSINLGMESSGKLSQMDVLRIKELTGNKTISIERKGMDRVDYPNYSTLVFASNDAINIGDFDDTGAFWERCKLIPCMHSCPLEQRDPYLLEKIWEERDSIVSKATRYAKRLIDNKFIFTEPRLAVEMKEMWKAAYENPVKAFIRESIKFVPIGSQQDCFIPTEKIYEEFLTFSEKNISIESFSKEFRKLTLGQAEKTKRRCAGYTNSVNGFLGVKIKEQVE